jgi:hypothetical protein
LCYPEAFVYWLKYKKIEVNLIRIEIIKYPIFVKIVRKGLQAASPGSKANGNTAESPVLCAIKNTVLMGMNKNSIFAWASFFLLLIGIALVLLGVLKYQDYAIGFSTVGIGFFVMSWA